METNSKTMSKMNKKGGTALTILVILLIAIVGGGAGYWGYNKLSSGGNSDEGETAPWAGKNIYKIVSIKDAYTNDDLNVSLEIFEEKPTSCWDDLSEDDCSEVSDTTATVSDGSVTVTDLTPGTYFVVARATNYIPEFFELVIPDGSDGAVAADYNQAPQTHSLKMKKIGALTVENSTMTFTSDEDGKEKSVFVNYVVDENECFVMGKLSVTESQNSLSEYDSDGISYEGIEMFKVKVAGTWVEVISSGDNGDFDSSTTGQKETFDLSDEGIEICDEGLLSVTYYVKADVNVSADTIGDKLLSNETIATISFKDQIGNAQNDVVLNAYHA